VTGGDHGDADYDLRRERQPGYFTFASKRAYEE